MTMVAYVEFFNRGRDCNFRDLFPDIQVIVPRRRIQFRKLVGGVEVPSGRCSFDCLYFCWRLGLPRDVVFLT